MLGTVIGAMFTAFIIGALARFAVPGPDPMPAWLTVAIGLLGVGIGYGAVYAITGKDSSWAPTVSLVAAVGLVLIYRRFVQKRPLWGKDAFRFPERGFGIKRYRERLTRAGIDPDQIGIQGLGTAQQTVTPLQTAPARADTAGDPTENPAHYLGLLEELHDSHVLEDDEYAAARSRLLESLRS
ncbi:MAG TPA: hypothetical protein VFN33_06280 [Gaiellaceae bacterium]|nr:hypothetical protein [Gaiellaceae bacterium]